MTRSSTRTAASPCRRKVMPPKETSSDSLPCAAVAAALDATGALRATNEAAFLAVAAMVVPAAVAAAAVLTPRRRPLTRWRYVDSASSWATQYCGTLIPVVRRCLSCSCQNASPRSTIALPVRQSTRCLGGCGPSCCSGSIVNVLHAKTSTFSQEDPLRKNGDARTFTLQESTCEGGE